MLVKHYKHLNMDISPFLTILARKTDENYNMSTTSYPKDDEIDKTYYTNKILSTVDNDNNLLEVNHNQTSILHNIENIIPAIIISKKIVNDPHMGDALGYRSETKIFEIDNDTLIIDDEPSKHKQQGIVADPVYEDTNRLTSELVNQRSIDNIPMDGGL